MVPVCKPHGPRFSYASRSNAPSIIQVRYEERLPGMPRPVLRAPSRPRRTCPISSHIAASGPGPMLARILRHPSSCFPVASTVCHRLVCSTASPSSSGRERMIAPLSVSPPSCDLWVEQVEPCRHGQPHYAEPDYDGRQGFTSRLPSSFLLHFPPPSRVSFWFPSLPPSFPLDPVVCV